MTKTKQSMQDRMAERLEAKAIRKSKPNDVMLLRTSNTSTVQALLNRGWEVKSSGSTMAFSAGFTNYLLSKKHPMP